MNATIETFQASLDEWVHEYNTNRPHQSLGDRPPQERFALAGVRLSADDSEEIEDREE